MNILYLGSFAIDSLVQKYPNYSLGKYRTSKFILDNLRKEARTDVIIITSPDLPSYPSFPKFFLKGQQEDGVLMVSSLNLPFVKQIWTICSMTLHAVCCLRNKKIDWIIIPYLVFRHVATARILKHLFPRVKICAIVPDIFFPVRGSKGYRMNRWAQRHGAQCDAFILYTEAMADFLKIKDKSYVVEEGFLDTKYFDSLMAEKEPKKDSIRRIVYSGTLMKQYGVLRLVEAMRFVSKPDVELCLYGDGDALNEIDQASREDHRIKYMGWADKRTVFSALSNATVLVNPRSESDGDFTQFSFPSKILEYLYSGTPTVACPLSGIPPAYYDHFILTDGSAESLAKSINIGLDMTEEERKKKGESNRVFIRQHVGIDNQCRRIVQLLIDAKQ